MSFKRNTAVLGFKVGLVSAVDGSDINTVSPVGYYTLDNGSQLAIADVTPTFKGNGEWAFDLLASELDGIVVGLTFTHTVGITKHFTIKTVVKEVVDLQDIAITDVKAQVVEAINVDTYGEPAQGTPGENVTLVYKWGLLYKTLVNEKSFDGSVINILNYAGTVVDQKRPASQVGGTYTEENIVTGL